jgi:hypothetical protein
MWNQSKPKAASAGFIVALAGQLPIGFHLIMVLPSMFLNPTKPIPIKKKCLKRVSHTPFYRHLMTPKCGLAHD